MNLEGPQKTTERTKKTTKQRGGEGLERKLIADGRKRAEVGGRKRGTLRITKGKQRQTKFQEWRGPNVKKVGDNKSLILGAEAGIRKVTKQGKRQDWKDFIERVL